VTSFAAVCEGLEEERDGGLRRSETQTKLLLSTRRSARGRCAGNNDGDGRGQTGRLLV